MVRALSVFAEFAFYQFFDYVDAEVSDMRRQVLSEIEGVKNGTAEYVISSAMQWVEQVRLRAARDYAVRDATHFGKAWTAVDYKDWPSEQWAVCLRTREDRDIGWIPCSRQFGPPSP